MRFYFTLFLFLSSLFSIAQIPNPLKEVGDTLQTIESDTSVIYVIEVEPVTIIDKVEIVKPKSNYYFTTHASIFSFHEYKKASPGFENYLSRVTDVTHDLPSYAVGLSFWKCPKRIATGYNVNFKRLCQQFNYTDSTNIHYKTTNYFNYASLGIMAGYWINKGKKISCLIVGKAHLDNLLSYSKHTLSKTNPAISTSIRDQMAYREYIADFTITSRFLFAIGNQCMEISPFLAVMPFSATKKNEAYSVQSMLAGITVGITYKLF